jgi:hypothetical protein
MSTLFKLPKWALIGQTLEPSEGKKLSGWVGAGERPGFKTFNWLAAQTYEWLLNLSISSASYSNVNEFIEKAEPGDAGFIVPSYGTGSQAPNETIQTEATVAIVSVSTDGQYFVITESSSITIRPRTDLATITRTFTPTIAGTTLKAISNGKYLALVRGQNIEIFLRDTGVSVGSYDHGGIITDVAIDSTRAYIVGAKVGAITTRAVTLSTAALAWSHSHDATLNCVVTDGLRVYVGGNAAGAGATSAVGSHVVALTASSGAVEWSQTDAAVAGPERMATDGEELFTVATTTAIRKRHCTTGGVSQTTTLANILAIEIDHDYLFLSVPAGVYVAPRGVNLSGAAPVGLYTEAANVGGIASDGEFLVLKINATSHKTRHRPSNRPRRWYRANTDTDTFLPYRRVAFPLD